MITAASLAGFTESRKLSLREQELERFLRFLSNARTEIRYASMPVEELVRRHGEGLALWRPCMDALEAGEGFSRAWNDGVRVSKGMGLTGKDRALLMSFGEGLGTTDLEGQMAHCDLYEGLIRCALEEAKGEKEKKGKLYQMLGVSAGLAAALLLW